MNGNDSLDWLARECELRLRFTRPGYTVRELVAPATTLYDPMLGFVDDDDCVVFCDIGGQPEPGWDPDAGHGAIWRLHPDDRLEAIVPVGHIGRGMIMYPTRAPASFGTHAGETFFLGQLRPGRPGAHHTHAVYWLPPGSSWPEPFVIVPDSGTMGGGTAGALSFTGWGADGTSESGAMFVHSLMNCTIYRVTPDRRIEPWMVCDTEHVGHQVMPLRMFRAGPEWGPLESELIVTGRPDTSFGQPIAGDVAAFHAIETPHGHRLEPVESHDPLGADGRLARPQLAPPSFGPLAGKYFFCRGGSTTGTNTNSTMNTGEGSLPYDADIVWFDDEDNPQVFADQLQTGAPALIFQGDRMIVSLVRMSYSTGQFHYPDGSLYEITYSGDSLAVTTSSSTVPAP